MTAPIATAPALELTPQAMDHLAEALRESHAISRPWFPRRAQREWAEQSLHGLLLEIPRTSIEPMVLVLEGANAHAVRTLPLLISEGTWEDGALLKRHWPEVEQALGEEEGGLTLDGSACLQQGQESVGVQRQDCGAGGTRATGQAGVSVGSASRTGSTLRARRLSRPQEWIEEEA